MAGVYFRLKNCANIVFFRAMLSAKCGNNFNSQKLYIKLCLIFFIYMKKYKFGGFKFLMQQVKNNLLYGKV